MTVSIFTYSNPYRLNNEKYWNRIKDAFQLCAAQTLVNGMCDQYKEFYIGKVTTIDNYIQHLYKDWEDDPMQIRQRADIDNILNSSEVRCLVPANKNPDKVIQSLRLNRENIFQSIRIMFELGIDPNNVLVDKLTDEQNILYKIYRQLIESNDPNFYLPKIFKEEEISSAIENTISDASNGKISEAVIKNINRRVIVIHGIHQFTPIMLRTIELLSNYHDVILLFNYQPDFKNIYQTWLDVYGCFETNIIQSSIDMSGLLPTSEGRRLADDLGNLAKGNTSRIQANNLLSIIEFSNVSEFSNYIATLFEEAERKRKADHFLHPTLYYMQEQIYSANNGVNEILKIYFPEQFGERQFLDYPIGHFFIAIANMWNSEKQMQEISDLNDIRDCLSCGILKEKNPGELLSIYNKTNLYFSDSKTIKGIISKLSDLSWRIDDINDDPDYEFGKQIKYCTVEKDEINKLKSALNELDQISQMFYADFSSHRSDFKKFYAKVVDILKKRVIPDPNIDEEFRDVVQRVLARLNEVANTEAFASFDCLKDTMQVYLQQKPDTRKSANWIVRNFEQIDGDALRKSQADHERIYHFACLSDKDMGVTARELFPWPLDLHFFEVAQRPVDWKYQAYVTSKQEYKNFKRYAFVYGLSFCNCKIKISYIKNEDNETTEPYYMLRILNAHIVQNNQNYKNKRLEDGSLIKPKASEHKSDYTSYDLMKYRLCSYRFLLESVVGSGSVYSDPFQLSYFATIILENRARRNFQGKVFSEINTHKYLEQEKHNIEDYFDFLVNSEWMDIISKAESFIKKSVIKKNAIYPRLSDSTIDYMKKMELFMAASISDKKRNDEVFQVSTQTEVNSELDDVKLASKKLKKSWSSICKNCSVKNLCLEVYKRKQ